MVLEVDELRPLLSSGSPDGASLTSRLRRAYEEQYEEALPADATFLWSGPGMGVMDVIVGDEDGPSRRTSICPECLASFSDEAIPDVTTDDVEIETWLSARRERVRSLTSAVAPLPLGERAVALECDFGDTYEDLCPGEFDDSGLPAKGSVYIVDGQGAFTDFYQEKRDWPSYDEDTGLSPDEHCSTGCTPVAALTMLDYWERHGYSYVIDPPNNIDTVSMSDAYEEKRYGILRDLRIHLETYCSEDEDSTAAGSPTRNIATLDDYINAKVNALDQDVSHRWEVDLVEPETWKERLRVIRSEIDVSRPLFVSYVSTWRDAVENDGDSITRHTAVVYGYYDDGETSVPNDLYVVRTGWSGTGSFPKVRVEPIIGTGNTYLTTVEPPSCEPGGIPPLCKTYTDLPRNHWGYQPVSSLSCDCVIEGRRDGKFYPNDSITREEMIKIAVVLAFPGTQQRIARTGISDVLPTRWSAAYVAKANDVGALDFLIDDANNLHPTRAITRAETAMLFIELGQSQDAAQALRRLRNQVTCELINPQPLRYPDVTPVTLGYHAIVAASRACVFEGYEDGTFRPANNISRVEAAKVACFAAYGYGSERCGDSDGTCDVIPCP